MESAHSYTISAAEKLALIEKDIPKETIRSFKKWCERNPDEDYQYHEIGEFFATMTRGDKLELLEAMANIANILKLT